MFYQNKQQTFHYEVRKIKLIATTDRTKLSTVKKCNRGLEDERNCMKSYKLFTSNKLLEQVPLQ